QFGGADHPGVARHPITGESHLFIDSGYTTRILGVAARESRWLLGLLVDQLSDPALHFRHRWRNGDVVMWAERAAVHMSPKAFYPEHRRLTRVTAGHSRPGPAETRTEPETVLVGVD